MDELKNVIDWKKVRKECKRLGIYKGHFNASLYQYETACWNVCLSVRNSEKTTSFVLLGMVIYKLYGYRFEYCRLISEDLTPKKHRSFFDSIISYGYIDLLTDGKYNSATYKAGYWYYRYVDADGNVVETATEPFMHCFAVRDAFDMKSSYTSNSCFICFDEFIDPSKVYKDDFVLLADCVSTIFRKRFGWVNLLANTLDRQSIWFKELNISRDITNMALGESKRIANPDCTPVLVNILPANISDAKKLHNLALFSFKNPKLEAITGVTDGWSVRVFQRLPRAKNRFLARNIYINAHGFVVRMDILINDIVGLCVQIVDTDVEYPIESKEDAILITTGDITQERTYYLFSNKNIWNFLSKMIHQNKVYFSSNEAGITFEHYINTNHTWNRR